MTHETDKAIAQIEHVLAEAAARPVELPPALVSRVLADAQAEQQPLQPKPAPPIDLLDVIRARAGKWGAVGGLVAASSVGFWLGVDPPVALDGLAFLPQQGIWGDTLGDAAELSGFGWELEES